LAPQNVAAQPGTGSATVTWTVPAGGGQVSSYQVSWSPASGAPVTVSAAARSAQVTGLSCATSYAFTVTAVGPSGVTVASGASAPISPCKTLGAPTNVVASAQSGGGIKVTWVAPTGADASTTYTVAYVGGSSGTVTTTAQSYMFAVGSPLTFLGTYSFTVTAGSAAGQSPASSSASARSGGTGQSFSVDVSATTTDPVNPCLPAQIAICHAGMRQGPSHTTTLEGNAPQGSTVTGFCYRSDGQTIRNDSGTSSTYWILISSGGSYGFVSTLWLGGASAWQRVWPCPSGYTVP
jgi:hypothetical protein